jgi:hypothetical protein
VRANRAEAIDSFLVSNPKIKFEKLVDDYYPELNYGKHPSVVSESDILKAEKDLLKRIDKMKPGKDKDALVEAYQKHQTSEFRKEALPSTGSSNREEVLANAQLPLDQRAKKAIELTGLRVSKQKDIEAGLGRAIQTGEGGALKSTSQEILEKSKKLQDAGLSEKEADQVIQSGLAGKVKPQDAYESLRKVVIPELSDDALTALLKHPDYGKILMAKTPAQRAPMARALKLFESHGFTPAESARTFKVFEKNMDYFQKIGGADSDVSSLLAEFISKQKKAGLGDEVIKKKIDNAFGPCK